jgi:hypothetical protein
MHNGFAKARWESRNPVLEIASKPDLWKNKTSRFALIGRDIPEMFKEVI